MKKLKHDLCNEEKKGPSCLFFLFRERVCMQHEVIKSLFKISCPWPGQILRELIFYFEARLSCFGISQNKNNKVLCSLYYINITRLGSVHLFRQKNRPGRKPFKKKHRTNTVCIIPRSTKNTCRSRVKQKQNATFFFFQI